MRTYRMPTAVHETTDLESSLEILHQCCGILGDYRKAGCPGSPESNDYVDRLIAIGVTREEAVEQLAITLENSEVA